MNAKETAQFLVQKYFDITMNLNLVDGGKQRAKDAARIEIANRIELLNTLVKAKYTSFITKEPVFIDGGLSEEAETYDGYEMLTFLERVEAEIEKL